MGQINLYSSATDKVHTQWSLSGFLPKEPQGRKKYGSVSPPIQLVLGQKPCHSAAEGSYGLTLDGETWGSASPHLRRVSPRFHIGTSLDSHLPAPRPGH